MSLSRRSTLEMEPRIKGYNRYDDGVSWIVNRLRRREVARFEYHHYTAFKIEIRHVSDLSYRVTIGFTGRRKPEGESVMALSWSPAYLRSAYGLPEHDAMTVANLLHDIGVAVR